MYIIILAIEYYGKRGLQGKDILKSSELGNLSIGRQVGRFNLLAFQRHSRSPLG